MTCANPLKDLMKIYFPYLESLNKAGGSEQGWAINVAKLCERLGHEVYLGRGYTGWDIEGREPFDRAFKADIMVLPERFDLWEDKSRWERHRQCSRRFLIAVFHPVGNPWLLDNKPTDTKFITPYRTMGRDCFVIPYSYYEIKPSPLFDNRTIGWTTRNVFSGISEQAPPSAQIHLYHLQACAKAVEQGHNLILFDNQGYDKHLTFNPGRHSIANSAYSLITDLRNHPSVITANNLPYDDYLQLLSKTSIVIPLDGLGSTTEALKLGSLPLSWGNGMELFDGFSYGGLAYNSLSYGTIESRLLNCLSNEDYYRNEYSIIFNKSAIYSLEQALELLRRVLEE